MRQALQKLGKGLADILFPRRCVWCGKVIGFAAECPCAAERQRLYLQEGERILPERETLPRLAVWACYAYDGALRDSILRYKFEGATRLADAFGEEMATLYARRNLNKEVDLIVPVPVSEETMEERGYNQSALLAAVLAVHVGVACEETVLKKCVETRPQMRLDRQARLQNLRGAFVAEPAFVRGKRVLLVDDIVTTGSTLQECAKTLYAAGAHTVTGICLASTAPDRIKRQKEEDES